MVSEKLTIELKSITRRIPTIKFVLISQVIVLSLVLLSFIVPGYLEVILHNILLVMLSFTILTSLLIFSLSDYSVDKIGFIAGVLLLSSLTLTILQAEWWIVYGRFEITIILLLVSTIITAAVGIYLIYNKLGRLGRKSIFMLTWIFSLFILLLFPLASEYLPFVTRERVITIVLFIALLTSTLFAILLTVNLWMKKSHLKLLDAGDMRRILGDTRGAEDHYTEALKLETAVGEVHTRLGDLFFAEGEHERALSHHEKSLGYLGDRNYRLAAVSASAIGLYAEAVTLIRKGLLAKTSPANWYILGRMFKHTGDHELESDCYRESLALDDQFWPAYFALAESVEGDEAFALFETALEKGGYDPSKREILKKLKSAGQFAPIFLHPADISFWKEESGEVNSEVIRSLLEYIIESLEITDPDIWETVNEAISNLDDFEANGFLTNTRQPEGIILRSIFCGSLGVKCEDEELKSLKNTERQDIAYYILGILKGIEADYNTALKYLSSVESIEVKPRAYAVKGCIYYQLNKPIEARRNWRTSLSLGYTGDDLLESLSLLAHELGEKEQSSYFSKTILSFPEIVLSDKEDDSIIEYIRRVSGNYHYEISEIPLSNNPKMAGAVKFLKGEYNQAEKLFDSVLKEAPEDADGHLGIGICLLGKRKFKAALKEIESAIEIKGSDPLHYFYRGIANFRLGKKQEALADFKTVFVHRPGWERNNHYISVCLANEN